MSRSSRPVLATSLLGALVLLAAASTADAALGRARGGVATVRATGPGGMNIEGKTSEVTVSEQDNKVHFVVPLGRVDTGIELRNKHMRNYLEADRYPTAELVVDRSALKFPADGQDVSASAPGTMLLHGQSKPVTVNYRARRTGASYDVSGTTRVNINDYGIKTPSYLGVSVKPDVEIKLQATVDDA